jgi:hypothetical protein
MFASDRLNHEAAMRKANERLIRATRFVCFMGIALIAMSMFAVFGYAGIRLTPNPDTIPTWLWNGTFFITTIQMLCFSGWATFKALDELLSSNSTHRMFGKR